MPENTSQDAALAQAAESGGGGNLFLDIAAGFATGFATGYTGRDLLSPFLAQQADRRKERTERIKLLNQVGTVINSYKDGGKIVDELLGLTEETGQDDRAKAYAALDQNMLRVISGQIDRARMDDKDENVKAEGAQALFTAWKPELDRLGIPYIGIDTRDPQSVQTLVAQGEFATKEEHRTEGAKNSLYTKSRDSFSELNVGAMTDAEFRALFLEPRAAEYQSKGLTAEWEREQPHFLERRAQKVKDYQTEESDKYLQARALPFVGDKRQTWGELTPLQQDRMAPQLSQEYTAIDRINDLPDHVREIFSEESLTVLETLGFDSTTSFRDWANNGGDVQALLDATPQLSKEIAQAELADDNLPVLQGSLPDFLSPEDVLPESYLTYKPGAQIMLTPEGKEKAQQELQAMLLDPSQPAAVRSDVMDQATLFGINMTDLLAGRERFSTLESYDLAAQGEAVSYEKSAQLDKNFMAGGEERITFEYAAGSSPLTAEQERVMSLLQTTDPKLLSQADLQELQALESRTDTATAQKASDQANRSSYAILLYGAEAVDASVIVEADIDPATMQPKNINVPALSAGLSRANGDAFEEWRALSSWMADNNKRSAGTAGERKESRSGQDIYARAEEIAGSENFPDLEMVHDSLRGEWLQRNRETYDRLVAARDPSVLTGGSLGSASALVEGQVVPFGTYLRDEGGDAPSNLDVLNLMFGHDLQDSEIKLLVDDNTVAIDIEEFDPEELAIFAAQLGLNA